MIALGCDHGGYELKQEIIKYLEENNLPFKDFGCYDNSSVDYPIYARKVTDAITHGECDKGILICGTGIGISIAANKVPGIRAALCTDCFCAEATRLHNDANILLNCCFCFRRYFRLFFICSVNPNCFIKNNDKNHCQYTKNNFLDFTLFAHSILSSFLTCCM